MDELKLGPIRMTLPTGFQLGSAVFVGPVQRDEAAMSDPLTAHSAEHRASINVVPSQESVAPEDLRAYAGTQTALLQKLMRYELVALEELRPATGAAILVRQKLADRGVLFEQYQLYRSLEGKTYVLTATALAGPSFEKHEPTFRKALLSSLS